MNGKVSDRILDAAKDLPLAWPFVQMALRAAIEAPSPDNNQPWKISPHEQSIDFFLDPARALPSDVGGMLDWLAIGAAVENARLVLKSHLPEPHSKALSVQVLTKQESTARRGARLSWDLRNSQDGTTGEIGGDEVRCRRQFPTVPAPNTNPPLCGCDETAEEIWSSSALAEQISKRHTCRESYSTRPIEEPLLTKLARAATEIQAIRVDWLSTRAQIRHAAWLVGAADRMRWEQPAFHAELFRQIRWTSDEAKARRDGLDIRTLALPPLIGGIVLRWTRHWPLLAVANRVGASVLLALPGVWQTLRSGAVGLISVHAPEPEAYFGAGRAFQRLWLGATAAGLQLQPMGSLPIFLAHLEQLHGAKLTVAQVRRCRAIRQKLWELAPGLEGRVLVMVFRIGYGRPSRYRSLRRGVEEVVERERSEPLAG